MRAMGFAVLVAGSLLQGCAVTKQFAEGMRCDGVCVKDFPGEHMSAAHRSEVVLLPPLYNLSVRDGQHTEIEQHIGLNESFGQGLHQGISPAARSYGIDMQYLPVAELPAAFSEARLLEWHSLLWIQDEDPEAIRAATPLRGFGAPEIIDPAVIRQLALGEATSEALSGACCIMLMRVNGWSYTRGTATGKTAMAIGFSVMPGGSGYVPPTSDVIADAAVIRLEDGEVLWSARYIGPTNPRVLRRLVMPYLSKTYNSNARLAREGLPREGLPREPLTREPLAAE